MIQEIVFFLLTSVVHSVHSSSSSYSQYRHPLVSSASSISDRSVEYSGHEDDAIAQAGEHVHHRELKGEITRQCYNTLIASAKDGKLRKPNYFTFTDGMSNGYYSFHNMTEFGDLPMKNKFGFSTLSCQCHAFGGSGNCCQGNRAHIDVTGIENDGGIVGMDTRLRGYVSDICRVTNDAIGDDKLPPSGELQATQWPTATPSMSVSPTESSQPTIAPSSSGAPSLLPSLVPSSLPSKSIQPSGSPSHSLGPSLQPTTSSSPSTTVMPTNVGNVPAIIAQPAKGEKEDTGGDGGLSGGAWAGIIFAAVAVIALAGYIIYDQKGRAVKESVSDVESQQRVDEESST